MATLTSKSVRLSVSSSLITTTAAIWRISVTEWLDAAADLCPLKINHFPYLPMVTNPKKQSFYPDGDPDRHQNLIVCSVAHCQPSLKISCKSVWKFLRKAANRQTDKQRRKHNLLGGGSQLDPFRRLASHNTPTFHIDTHACKIHRKSQTITTAG